MKPFLYFALAAYVVAAIHSILAFVNKRRAFERVSMASLGVGFAAHTAAIIIDWIQDGHYPLFYLHETISFLGWTLVIAYALAMSRYRAQALGVLTLPLVAIAGLRLERCAGEREPHTEPRHGRQRGVAVSDSYDAAALCVRGLFRRVCGERDVPFAGARVEVEDL